MENFSFVIQILSAGVIASFVTGVFSLIVAVKNNKKLVELEKIKQKFTVERQRYEEIHDAYEKLNNLIPEREKLQYICMNLPQTDEAGIDSLSNLISVTDSNMSKMFEHFQRFGFLFSQNEKQEINAKLKEIDKTSEKIININRKIVEPDGQDNDLHCVLELQARRINQATNFERFYFKMFEEKLRNLSDQRE